MGFLYVFTLIYQPEVRQPIRLVLFTLLSALSIGLHWYLLYIGPNENRYLAYFAVQGFLAFLVTLIGGSISLAYGMYMSLIGEAMGTLRNRRQAILTITGLLLLSAINTILIDGWGVLSTWAIIILPLTFFVIIYVVIFQRLAGERERAQNLLAELETTHRQLAEYAAQVEDLTLVNERQRMARELHDTLAQGLAGLILQLEAADSHLANGWDERAHAIIRQAMEHARSTLAEARQAIANLRDDQLVPADLKEAVGKEIDRFRIATGINCTTEIELPSELPENTRINALRAVSEGLSNIIRHAQAQHILIRMAPQNGWLEITISDDGRGFDPQTALGRSGHYGLLGIRERVRLGGGKFEIQSTPGEGTTLTLLLPAG